MLFELSSDLNLFLRISSKKILVSRLLYKGDNVTISLIVQDARRDGWRIGIADSVRESCNTKNVYYIKKKENEFALQMSEVTQMVKCVPGNMGQTRSGQ